MSPSRRLLIAGLEATELLTLSARLPTYIRWAMKSPSWRAARGHWL